MKLLGFDVVANALACCGLIGLSLAAAPLHAQVGARPLSMADAERLALQAQPALATLERAADAAREAAIADRQLADPRVRLGIINLPVTTGDAWRFDRDDQTMAAIGIVQDVTRADKREAAGRRQDALAEAALAERDAEARRIRRDTALAWLDAWSAARRSELLERSREEFAAEREVTASRLATGGADARDVFSVDAAAAMIDDQRATAIRDERRARALLARWIGPDASRPLAASLDDAQDAPRALAERLRGDSGAMHPQIAGARAMQEVAQREAERAQLETTRDWSWEVSYGKRFAGRSDMVTLQVEVPLLWDTPSRQDRRSAEKRALAERAHLQVLDRERQLAADREAALIDWEAALARARVLQRQLVPAVEARLESTLAAYRAGKVAYGAVADARRALIDARVQQLALRSDVAKAAVTLQYFE